MAIKFEELMKVDKAEQTYQGFVKVVDEGLKVAAHMGGLSVNAVPVDNQTSHGLLRIQFKGPISEHHQSRLDREYTLAGWKVKGIFPDTHGLYAIEFYIKY